MRSAGDSGSPVADPSHPTGPRSRSPATCGAAMDVPERVFVPPPFQSDRMPTPGAAKSTGGFPQLENQAKPSELLVAEIV